MTHTQAVGSRAQVMHGTAHHTSGGLTKKDLKLNPKTGEYVSKVKSALGKKNPWIKAVKKAKKDVGADKMSLVKGALLRRAHEIFDK